jgi:hypothetical protein
MDSKLSPFGGGKQGNGLPKCLNEKDRHLLAELADSFPGLWFDSTDVRRLRIEGVESDQRMVQVAKMVNEGTVAQLGSRYRVTERAKQVLESLQTLPPSPAVIVATAQTVVPATEEQSPVDWDVLDEAEFFLRAISHGHVFRTDDNLAQHLSGDSEETAESLLQAFLKLGVVTTKMELTPIGYRQVLVPCWKVLSELRARKLEGNLFLSAIQPEQEVAATPENVAA